MGAARAPRAEERAAHAAETAAMGRVDWEVTVAVVVAAAVMAAMVVAMAGGLAVAEVTVAAEVVEMETATVEVAEEVTAGTRTLLRMCALWVCCPGLGVYRTHPEPEQVQMVRTVAATLANLRGLCSHPIACG